jgi:hypothetical protein
MKHLPSLDIRDAAACLEDGGEDEGIGLEAFSQHSIEPVERPAEAAMVDVAGDEGGPAYQTSDRKLFQHSLGF